MAVGYGGHYQPVFQGDSYAYVDVWGCLNIAVLVEGVEGGELCECLSDRLDYDVVDAYVHVSVGPI